MDDIHISKRGTKTPQIVIDQIKRSNKISTYLSERGVNPKSNSGGNLLYNCPLPNHLHDKSPSFYIYDKGDYEDFYCYGCKCGGNIVNFVAEYEHLGLRKALQRLSDGIGIDIQDVMDAIILDIVTDTERPSPREGLELAFCLNKLLHDYIKACEFHPDEIEIADKMGRVIEKYLYAENLEALRSLLYADGKENLDYYVRHRVNLFNCRKQEEEIALIRSKQSGEHNDYTAQKILRENG